MRREEDEAVEVGAQQSLKIAVQLNLAVDEED